MIKTSFRNKENLSEVRPLCTCDMSSVSRSAPVKLGIFSLYDWWNQQWVSRPVLDCELVK